MKFKFEIEAPEFDEQNEYADLVTCEIVRQLKPQVERDIKEKALTGITGIVGESVSSIVAETLKGEIQLTNTYGEKTGKTTTLRELIMATVQSWLVAKVDYNGRETNYGNDGKPRINWMIDAAVKTEAEGQIKQAIAATVADVRSKLTASATAQLAEGVTKLLGVKAS